MAWGAHKQAFVLLPGDSGLGAGRSFKTPSHVCPLSYRGLTCPAGFWPQPREHGQDYRAWTCGWTRVSSKMLMTMTSGGVLLGSGVSG